MEVKQWEELHQVDWVSHLKAALSWEDLDLFERSFPETFQLHPKRKVTIQYFEEGPPKTIQQVTRLL